MSYKIIKDKLKSILNSDRIETINVIVYSNEYETIIHNKINGINIELKNKFFFYPLEWRLEKKVFKEFNKNKYPLLKISNGYLLSKKDVEEVWEWLNQK